MKHSQTARVQVRIKKHRWHKKILKNNDPLIFSVGWRRFQSVPLYSMKTVNQFEIQNARHFSGSTLPAGENFIAHRSESWKDCQKSFRLPRFVAYDLMHAPQNPCSKPPKCSCY
jgi:hypothetical protein